jgi:hypothetical protein
MAFGPSSCNAHIAPLQTARLLRHGATMQVTLGPVQAGGSIPAGKIKQRQDPHVLSTALHALSALHERSGAGGVLGSERIGSGGPASAAAGAFAPDAPVDVDGAPTRVMLDGDWVDASTVAASRSAGTDAPGVCPAGSLES